MKTSNKHMINNTNGTDLGCLPMGILQRRDVASANKPSQWSYFNDHGLGVFLKGDDDL